MTRIANCSLHFLKAMLQFHPPWTPKCLWRLKLQKRKLNWRRWKFSVIGNLTIIFSHEWTHREGLWVKHNPLQQRFLSLDGLYCVWSQVLHPGSSRTFKNPFLKAYESPFGERKKVMKMVPWFVLIGCLTWLSKLETKNFRVRHSFFLFEMENTDMTFQSVSLASPRSACETSHQFNTPLLFSALSLSSKRKTENFHIVPLP